MKYLKEEILGNREEVLLKVEEWITQGYHHTVIAKMLNIRHSDSRDLFDEVLARWKEKRDEKIEFYTTKSFVELEILKHKCWLAYAERPTRTTKFGIEDNLEPLKLIAVCIEKTARLAEQFNGYGNKIPIAELAAISQLTKSDLLPPEMLNTFASGLQDLMARIKEIGSGNSKPKESEGLEIIDDPNPNEIKVVSTVEVKSKRGRKKKHVEPETKPQ